MNWKEFAASLVGDLLSWPVLLLVLALLFQGPIRELISRMKALEGFGSRAEFSSQLDAMEESVEDVLEDAEVAQADAVLGENKSESRHASRGAGDAGRDPGAAAAGAGAGAAISHSEDPSGAIIRAWTNLSDVLQELAALHAGRGRPTRRPELIIDQLLRNDVITPSFHNAAVNLLELRNKVAHGQEVPSVGAAITYVEGAHRLESVARGMIAVGRIDTTRSAKM